MNFDHSIDDRSVRRFQPLDDLSKREFVAPDRLELTIPAQPEKLHEHLDSIQNELSDRSPKEAVGIVQPKVVQTHQ
jgi:hypothetical protein